jgi:hypothetical protein
MKKIMLVAALAVLATAVFAQSGVIKNLSGTVELKPAGASSFVPAKEGDAVAQDTIVSTGYKSGAVVVAGSSTIQVKALTRLTLAELSQQSGVERINVNLQAGRVKVDVKPPSGTRTDFTVKSPSATASVRGTGFDFDGKNLSVNDGRVAFAGASGGTVFVSAGNTSTAVDVSGRAADPIETSAATLLPPAPSGADGVAASASTAPKKVEYSMTFTWTN